jgi:hypothetical protein
MQLIYSSKPKDSGTLISTDNLIHAEDRFRLLTKSEIAHRYAVTSRTVNEWMRRGAELLFEVISRAYERISLVVTTNLPFENWTDERLTGAMLDRLTHRVHILEANGESFRLTNAKKRLRPR